MLFAYDNTTEGNHESVKNGLEAIFEDDTDFVGAYFATQSLVRLVSVKPFLKAEVKGALAATRLRARAMLNQARVVRAGCHLLEQAPGRAAKELAPIDKPDLETLAMISRDLVFQKQGERKPNDDGYDKDFDHQYKRLMSLVA
jgi:hypothetical protein